MAESKYGALHTPTLRETPSRSYGQNSEGKSQRIVFVSSQVADPGLYLSHWTLTWSTKWFLSCVALRSNIHNGSTLIVC